MGRMVVSLILALVFGSVYARQNYTSGADLLARVGVIYCTVMFQGMHFDASF